MRQIVKIGLVFFILQTILFCLDEIYTFGLLRNENSKLSRIQSPGTEAEVLFHGACEPHWAISPSMLEKEVPCRMYNLSLNNSDFADNFLHLYLYLQHNDPPRLVFLYVTPAGLDSAINTFNSFRFAPFLKDNLVDSVVRDMDPGYHRWCGIPFMRYAYYNSEITFNMVQGYKHFFGGRVEAYYPDGYEPPAERAFGAEQGVYVMRHCVPVKYSWNKKRERYLRKTIQLARSAGSKVVLFELPVYEDFLRLETNRSEFEKQIAKVAQQEKTTYVQFKGLSLAKDSSNYNAPRNFNRKGVVLFADTFGKYLKEVCSKTGN